MLPHSNVINNSSTVSRIHVKEVVSVGREFWKGIKEEKGMCFIQVFFLRKYIYIVDLLSCEGLHRRNFLKTKLV